jgi:MFS family permease
MVVQTLVDRFAPRHVLSTQFGALAIALAVNAAVGTPWLLGLVFGVVGAGSSVCAQLSSVAGRFANPQCRATMLGIVTAGISAGILAGRIVGWLNDEIGWRGMFLVFAIACAFVAVSAFFVLPGAAGSVTSGHLASLRRLPVLYLQCAPLQLAAGRGALWFFAFCAVWAGLAIDPAAPAQFNSAYMLIYFVGGSVGTAFGAAAVGWFGWPATTAIAACAIALAMIVTATVRGNTRSLG